MNSAASDRIQAWLEGPYDEETKGEIRRLLIEDPQALDDAFFKDLTFGTGGLRAVTGIGTNRLNIYTVRKATQGLANYIKKTEGPHAVFIGYDVRHHSREFALESTKVLAGNGIEVLITEEICPTPLVSFGCRLFGCKAAIMITASHNPPQYNGYKVYWTDGGQITPPHDRGIIDEVGKVEDLYQILLSPPDSPLIRWIGRELDEAYLEQLSHLQLSPSPLQVLYTPLHGTGIRIIPRALASWGFSCDLIESQKNPDGNFTHAASPNPEEAEALQVGCEELEKKGGDLLIATDPDADRVGIAVLHKGKAVRLTGNQIACVCLDHICSSLKSRGQLDKNSSFLKTIVTTELFRKIAESYHSLCFDLLTGFKYIGERIALWERTSAPNRYIFGGEESYGYLFGTFVRDKDAISSSCLIAEAAGSARKQTLTLIDKLHQLYRKFGVHRESLTNLSFPETLSGMEQIGQLMDRLRKNPPAHIGSIAVASCDDYQTSLSYDLLKNEKTPIDLPTSNVLRFWLEDGSKLVIRPSGTEPKVKIYAEVSKRAEDIEAAIQECDERLIDLVDSFKMIT